MAPGKKRKHDKRMSLVEDRMGITVARWDLYSAEAVLRLRTLSINGDWDAYSAFHERQHALRNARNHAV